MYKSHTFVFAREVVIEYSIPKAQQKVFVDHFLAQVLQIAQQLVEQGKDRDSPGETVDAVSRAVIKQIQQLDAGEQT